MKGWLAGQSVGEVGRRGEENSGFSPEGKKGQGFHQMMEEGGRDED